MIEIRRANTQDAPQIADLLTALTRRHIAADCTVQGLEILLGTMTFEAVLERMAGDFWHWLAVAGDKLAGVCVMRGESHLYHLFVADGFQRQGIARRLWQTALDDARRRTPGLRVFTVNASSFGRPAYERMGFVVEDEPQIVDGIRLQAMRLEI